MNFKAYFHLPKKITSSRSIVIETVHWLHHSVHIFTSRAGQIYRQDQHPDTHVKYAMFILLREKKDGAHSTCSFGGRHLHCWIMHKNCLYQKWYCASHQSADTHDKLILQPLYIPPIVEDRHALGLHFPVWILWLSYGSASKHQNHNCIKVKSATPLQHKCFFGWLGFVFCFSFVCLGFLVFFLWVLTWELHVTVIWGEGV